MSKLAEFKSSLERALGIIRWSPSEDQLLRIARMVAASEPTPHAIFGAVDAVCPDRTSFVTEGVDNSDLRALVALAIAAVAKASPSANG